MSYYIIRYDHGHYDRTTENCRLSLEHIYIYVWWVHFPWSGWGTGASLSGFLDLSCYRLDMKNQKKVSIILPSECKAKSYVRNSPRTLKHMLVGGWPTLWKIWKSVGMMTFPIYGKIKAMFQTTNQILLVSYPRERKKKHFVALNPRFRPMGHWNHPAPSILSFAAARTSRDPVAELCGAAITSAGGPRVARARAHQEPPWRWHDRHLLELGEGIVILPMLDHVGVETHVITVAKYRII